MRHNILESSLDENSSATDTQVALSEIVQDLVRTLYTLPPPPLKHQDFARIWKVIRLKLHIFVPLHLSIRKLDIIVEQYICQHKLHLITRKEPARTGMMSISKPHRIRGDSNQLMAIRLIFALVPRVVEAITIEDIGVGPRTDLRVPGHCVHRYFKIGAGWNICSVGECEWD